MRKPTKVKGTTPPIQRDSQRPTDSTRQPRARTRSIALRFARLIKTEWSAA